MGAVLVGVALAQTAFEGAALADAAILREHLLTPFHQNAEV